MTKGALYHHFDSKDSLASAIIEEGSETLVVAFRNVCASSSPGLENMIHGTFAVATVLSSNKMVARGRAIDRRAQWIQQSGRAFLRKPGRADDCRGAARSAEGDLREALAPAVVGESVVGAMFGTRLLSSAIAAKGRAETTSTKSSSGEPAACGSCYSAVSLRRRRSHTSASFWFARRCATRQPPAAAPESIS